jgi:hypothetical protein
LVERKPHDRSAAAKLGHSRAKPLTKTDLAVLPSYVEKNPYNVHRWTKARREGRIEVQTWHEWVSVGDNEWDWTGVTQKRERVIPIEGRRCIAIYKRGPWVGERCVQPSIKGGRVCTQHGGKLPEVKKNAQRTLALAALPAAERLVHIALFKRNVLDKDRIKALVEILNRAGVEGKTTVEIEVKPYQEILGMVDVMANTEPLPGADIELKEGVDFEVADEDDDKLLEDDDDD